MLLTGCAYEIDYDSSPRGAEVICNGDHVGRTPVTVQYRDIDPDKVSSFRTGCIVQWASGAAAGVGEVDIYSNKYTHVTVERPEEYPNLDKDLRVEFNSEFNRIQYEKNSEKMREYIEEQEQEKEDKEELDRITSKD